MRSWRSKFDDDDDEDDGGGGCGGDRDDEQQTKQGREKSRAAKCEDHGSGTREPESTFPPTPRRQTVCSSDDTKNIAVDGRYRAFALL